MYVRVVSSVHKSGVKYRVFASVELYCKTVVYAFEAHGGGQEAAAGRRGI